MPPFNLPDNITARDFFCDAFCITEEVPCNSGIRHFI